jgi:hypothetical protein
MQGGHRRPMPTYTMYYQQGFNFVSTILRSKKLWDSEQGNIHVAWQGGE